MKKKASSKKQNTLAIDGGKPVRSKPWPARSLFGAQEKRAVDALFDKCIATGATIGYNGPEETAYCQEFAKFMGGGYADAVNSGTTAVYVALRAINPEPYTEIITPPVTDPGGAMPVPLINCIPIPADTAPGSYSPGAEQIKARITKRTSAIIVAHIAGHPADMDGIMALARAKRIPVIEDCAQAHGAKYHGKLVGTFGDVAAFSTMFGKHHATGGQGGIVFTKNEKLYWAVRRAADRGKPFGMSAASNVVAALNLNSNELNCAIGRVQLKKLPRIIAARQKAAKAVAQGCRKALKTVRLDTGLARTQSVFWFLLFTLKLNRISVDKETFVNALRAEGLPVGPGYLHVPSEAQWYKDRAVFGTSGLPWTSPLYTGNGDRNYPLPNIHATDACRFTLDFHEKLGAREIADVIAALKKVEAAYIK